MYTHMTWLTLSRSILLRIRSIVSLSFADTRALLSNLPTIFNEAICTKRHEASSRCRSSTSLFKIPLIEHLTVQGGKESLSVAVIDESYTFDLMEIHVKNLDLEFQGQNIFFFLHCILFVAKVKVFSRNHR